MKLKLLALGLILSLALSKQANAGIYGDDLSRCLLESATQKDKITLVKWMFTAMSLHPAIKTMANVSDEQRQQANKEMGELMVDLISVRCLEKTKKAVQFEGPVAIQASFKLFGQMAGRELFTSPDVAKGIAGIRDFIDTEALNKKLGLSNDAEKLR